MKIRLIKKLIKQGKLDGNTNKKYISWSLKKLYSKAWNTAHSGNFGKKWDNLNAQIEYLEQRLYRI